MTPEPTPVLGMSAPNTPVSPPVVVVIFTTAGPAFAAASMTADDSSMVTGCCALVCWFEPVGAEATWRSSAPVRSSRTAVPPAASTADSSEAVTTVPTPVGPRFLREVAGDTGTEYPAWPGDAAVCGAPHAGPDGGADGPDVPGPACVPEAVGP